ncbi:hypothetical protein BC833DRAFT_600417 [Globomyces pollinis-pini]|nr:hypothetical protein BC833DRAFT_600417 [Globomyces pollinis-pini]
MNNDSGISVSPDFKPSLLTPTSEIGLSLEASEFVAFAMYRLWNPKKVRISKKSSHIQTLPNPLPNCIDSSLGPLICPPGTESWYVLYVHNIHKLLQKSKLPTPIIFIALLYIARLRQVIATEATPGQESQLLFQLFLAALMVAHKQNSDFRYSNRTWSTISGYSLPELNQLERNFLKGMHWKLHCSDDQYTQWVTIIQKLGKEHSLVLKACCLPEAELQKLANEKLRSRPDLVEEITLIRQGFTCR